MSDANDQLLKPGTTVRLVRDPGRIGVLTDKVRQQAGVTKYQVNFGDGRTFVADFDLEVVSDDNDDWDGLIEAGKFGRVRDLRRNLTHIHLSGKLANLVYSMDATNTDFYAYQYKPVLSFLDSPSGGLLIADEVGLGKTIEAGLIWTELRARLDARRLLVVCPAMLREKWKSELSKRFGVDAVIMSADELLQHLREDKHKIPDGKGIICSLHGLRPPKGWKNEDEKKSGAAKLARFLEDMADDEPLIDLAIIDEAHYLRNPDSQSARLGGLLRGVSENIVLLSATPINLSDDDLFHLLKLVDPDSFAVKDIFPQVINANEHLNRARDLVLMPGSSAQEVQEELEEASQHHLLSNSAQLKALVNSHSVDHWLSTKSGRVELASKIEKINLLRHAITRTRKSEVTEWRVVREPVKRFIELDEEGPEWQFYQMVTESIRRYAWETDIHDGFLLAGPQRQVSSCMYAAAVAWKDKYSNYEEQVYEDLGLEIEDVDVSPLMERLHREVLPVIDLAELRRCDSKYKEFKETISEYIKQNPKEKIIVFSFFRKTLTYLRDRLSEDGIVAKVLMGGMKESKDEIISEFRESSDISVLLSSEVASEGVDLQFSRVLINYDLPWNPMKVEQRIGRIDRLGQQAEKISIVNILFKNTIDHKIHERLYSRLKIFERALGGMEAILGDEVTKLTADLLSQPLTPEQEQERVAKTSIAIERLKSEKEMLESQASHLIAHGGYILEEVQAAHQFKKRITEDDLISYVKDYLDKFCQGFEFLQKQNSEVDFDIRLPAKTAAEFADYIDKFKLHGLTNLARGEIVRCKFANKVRDPSTRSEVISQFHPLIRFISYQMNLLQESFYPLVGIKALAIEEVRPDTYAFFVNRWDFSGLKVEEDLPVRVIRMSDGELLDRDESWMVLNLARVNGSDWSDINNTIDTNKFQESVFKCIEALDADFDAERAQRENENADRVSFQIQSAEKHKERQLKARQEALERYRYTGKTQMIPAMEGRLRKIQERFDVQKEQLTLKSQLNSSYVEVCCGAILVE